MPVTRRRLLSGIFITWWSLIYGVWGFLGAIDLAISKFGSPALQVWWNSHWIVPKRGFKDWFIGFLLIIVCIVFERSYRELRKTSLPLKLTVVHSCIAEGTAIKQRSPRLDDDTGVCRTWNDDVSRWAGTTYKRLEKDVSRQAAGKFVTDFNVHQRFYPGRPKECADMMLTLDCRLKNLDEIVANPNGYLPT